jgi:hypothetical protein
VANNFLAAEADVGCIKLADIFCSDMLQDCFRPFFFSFPCQSCNKRKKSDGSELQAMGKIK